MMSLLKRMTSLCTAAALASLGLIAASLSPSQAQACASCGSGSDDPLVLWPNEELKTYVGFSSSSRFEAVDTQGKFGKESGPKSRDALTFAVGKAMRNDVFVTLTLPVQQNRLEGSSLRSLGDPILAARWSWWMPDFTEPLRPQIQLMTSYKVAHAKSLQESTRPDLLDAFGTGIPELKLGVDAFWGMNTFKGGFAVAGLFPEERKLGRTTVFPGNGLRATTTVGYSLGGDSKI
ncbi:hypothetical protein EBR21_03620, partial [bacterium]|nr:hypothetical protein [bacterium]